MFPSDILFRLLFSVSIISAGLAVAWLANRLVLRRAQRSQSSLPLVHPGLPTILYFTTPDCLPCKTVQRPALQRLAEKMGDRLCVIEINAQEHPDLASQWGVLSVPTTFILDPAGRPRHVNHGVTRAEKLAEQLISVQ
jgi:thiol-disulfide isomerase/thioredoxin